MPGIWVTGVAGIGLLVDNGDWSRAREAVDFVLQQRPPVVAGFDFSFGVPAWFARELDCATIDDVWARAASDGERWLAPTRAVLARTVRGAGRATVPRV